MANETREIVGVVGDVQQRPSWGSPVPLGTLPAAYLPLAQTSDDFLELAHTWFSPSLTLRASVSPASVRPSVREALSAADALLPIASFRTVEDVKKGILAFPRLLAYVLVGFATLAALLTVVGIYGIVSQGVAARGRELCIRMAMGATVPQAILTAVRPSLQLAALGMALGCALALMLSPLLRGLLWGVDATDPYSIAGALLAAFLAAVVASWMPASRIAHMSLARRLRAE